ncbi:alcohol dehydrogenase [Penicillium longicatenatum]|uniref:alcohol dehydrogenase n=1 Tax=Penicillium longicatenatum TaxID=1561947 RepID=UPI002547CE4A|nr:alcohol dehydrogenase [Penicillium longicatenatum]KAJ5636078.1 alcohol dehydrogenase [Penicillium longicatenatum]
MSLPDTTRAFRRTSGPIPRSLELITEKLPSTLQPDEVLVRVHAVSLNYRDVAMLHGKYPDTSIKKGIPASDCAAEVISTGSKVIQFKAATITCAGTTAWNALGTPSTRDSGKVALLQGTGGVSMFALQICLAAGIRPIITSSSDKKLEMARSLGSPGTVDTINYKTHPEWEKEVLRLTDGNGADIVIENVGPATIVQSLASLAQRGTVSLVGFLGGFDLPSQAETATSSVLMKTAKLQGIFVGSIIDQQDLCNFLNERQVGLSAIIDQVFSFTDSNAAFDHLYSAQHQGKVIIKL